MANFSMFPIHPLSTDARGTGLRIHMKILSISNEISSKHWNSIFSSLQIIFLTTNILGTHHYLDFGIKPLIFLGKIIPLLHPHLLILKSVCVCVCVCVCISFPLLVVGFGVDMQPCYRWWYMSYVQGNSLETFLGKVQQKYTRYRQLHFLL